MPDLQSNALRHNIRPDGKEKRPARPGWQKDRKHRRMMEGDLPIVTFLSLLGMKDTLTHSLLEMPAKDAATPPCTFHKKSRT